MTITMVSAKRTNRVKRHNGTRFEIFFFFFFLKNFFFFVRNQEYGSDNDHASSLRPFAQLRWSGTKDSHTLEATLISYFFRVYTPQLSLGHILGPTRSASCQNSAGRLHNSAIVS